MSEARTHDPSADAADRLWRAWQRGQRPEVDVFLASQGPLSPSALAAVLRIDQTERWRIGEPVAAERYFERYPVLVADSEAAFDLIFSEYLLQEEQGGEPNVEAFARRFPQCAQTLRDQVELHRALKSESVLTVPGSCPQSDELNTVEGMALSEAWTYGSGLSSGPELAPEPALPERFGRYRIRARLGRGGMGTVYAAHDDRLERDVALKVPRLEGDERRVERFRREVRIAANIHHPNLCPVFDVGCIDGVHYLTMPLLRGEPLSTVLRRRGPLPARTVAGLAARVASALAAAHAAGIVHRDLKPANIMVDDRLEPIVVDFGLARSGRPTDTADTTWGDIVGTPAYLAPEQAEGDPMAVGPPADVYALGVILYELLTGRTPFTGSALSILKQVFTSEPEPPSSHVPGLDPALETICRTAMSRDSKARYASMDALASVLEDWMRRNDRGTSVGQVTSPTRRTISRRALAAGTVLGVIVLPLLLFATRSALAPRDEPILLPSGSRWNGTFRFRPPNQDYRGDVDLQVTECHGGTFAGRYSTESGVYCWQVRGSIHGTRIDAALVEAVRGAGAENAVGKARITGEITGRTLEGQYRDPDSVADLRLQRAD
jgi:serine/threonine protein kinase